jgi:hypothetical protein
MRAHYPAPCRNRLVCGCWSRPVTPSNGFAAPATVDRMAYPVPGLNYHLDGHRRRVAGG